MKLLCVATGIVFGLWVTSSAFDGMTYGQVPDVGPGKCVAGIDRDGREVPCDESGSSSGGGRSDSGMVNGKDATFGQSLIVWPVQTVAGLFIMPVCILYVVSGETGCWNKIWSNIIWGFPPVKLVQLAWPSSDEEIKKKSGSGFDTR